MEYLYYDKGVYQPGELDRKPGDLISLASMYAETIYSMETKLWERDCLAINPRVKRLHHA